ncbi:MAG: Asp-tRNA(Asn)/Glu-tRNA(Gln) amidotransferase C subunit [Arcticibacterium sp.]|jgi:Asp-tRNA(Asn)/Glu-tRNA(Gln) amidotransferase C subunit
MQTIKGNLKRALLSPCLHIAMSKTMTLEVLSSIKGAESSEAVEKLFDVIKRANIDLNNLEVAEGVPLSKLREDEVIESSALEKEIIKSNFPKSKNGYLVVSKVIEE